MEEGGGGVKRQISLALLMHSYDRSFGSVGTPTLKDYISWGMRGSEEEDFNESRSHQHKEHITMIV